MRYQIAAIALLPLLVGCSDSPTAPVPLVGMWQLVRYNGQPIPAQVAAGFTVTSGRLVLEPDGAFQQEMTETDPDGDQFPFVSSGTYEVMPNGVRLHYAGEGALVIDLRQEGDRLLDDGERTGIERIYRKDAESE